MPPVEEWETWPFDGELRPRALAAAGRGRASARSARTRPTAGAASTARSTRSGATSAGCSRRPGSRTDCRASCCSFRAGTSTSATSTTRRRPTSGGCSSASSARCARVPGVGRVHVCRWGDGSYHLHYWFMARPARFPQLIGNFAAVWDDVLPPTPQDVWDENLRSSRGARRRRGCAVGASTRRVRRGDRALSERARLHRGDDGAIHAAGERRVGGPGSSRREDDVDAGGDRRDGGSAPSAGTR